MRFVVGPMGYSLTLAVLISAFLNTIRLNSWRVWEMDSEECALVSAFFFLLCQ